MWNDWSLWVVRWMLTLSTIICENRYLSWHKLEEVHIPWSSLHRILHDKLKMCCIRSTWIPHFLTKEQMSTHVDMCKEWLSWIEDGPDFPLKVVMEEGSYVSLLEFLLKPPSPMWKSPSLPWRNKVCQPRSAFKVMLTTFLTAVSHYTNTFFQQILQSTELCVARCCRCWVIKSGESGLSSKTSCFSIIIICLATNLVCDSGVFRVWIRRHLPLSTV